MKTLLVLFLLGSTLDTAAGSPLSGNNGTTSPPKGRPRIGMTKLQAETYYGRPFNQSATAQGERWYYRLKFNEVYGRAFVPFYYDSPNVRWGSIDFGPDGRVKSFDWHAPRLP